MGLTAVNLHPYAVLCERAYTAERDGRAGTTEYAQGRINGAKVYALAGTHKNNNRQRAKGKAWWRRVIAWVKDWAALLRDILANVSMVPVYHPELGFRPIGFLKPALDVVDEIQPRISKSEPVDFVCHSLGGAAGALACELLAKRGYWIRYLFLFGTPRCGRLKFITSTNCSTKVRSFRFGKDPVTQVPPGWRKPAPFERIGIPGDDALDDHSLENYTSWSKKH